MIGLSPPTYDLSGVLLLPLHTDPAAEQGERRVSRTATLDGGAVVTDTGFADADRTLTVTVPNATEEAVSTARYLVRTYTSLTVSTRHGCYAAAPQRYRYSGGQLTLTLLVTERLSD